MELTYPDLEVVGSNPTSHPKFWGSDVIGSRTGLRNQCRKVYRFDPYLPYQMR